MTTIDPTLGRIPRVLVPIEVDALVLREPRDGFADCRMTDPDPAGGRQDLLPPPFADLTGTRPAGVHLHWALPDGLTHTRPTAATGADGSAAPAELPAIPDRWLVVRFMLGTTPDHRRTRALVIEAGGSPPVVTELDGWHEPGAATAARRSVDGPRTGRSRLVRVLRQRGRTGSASTTRSTTAYRGPLGYLVCGWYADPRLDPLADPAITSLIAFYARLAELGWSVPMSELEQDVLASPFPSVAAAPPAPAALAGLASLGERGPLITDGSWWPQGLLAHGSVVGIGWPDPGWPDAEEGLLGTGQGGPPDPSQTRVAFGSTTSDALGALMVGFLAAAQGVSEDDIISEDRMLEAFQLGVLSEIDHPDGRTRLDARLHADGFRALAGGESTADGDDDAGTVQRSQPRWFAPVEPAVVVQGLRRSLKHGGDGRFSPDGTLVCRLSGFTVTALSAQLGDGAQRAL